MSTSAVVSCDGLERLAELAHHALACRTERLRLQSRLLLRLEPSDGNCISQVGAWRVNASTTSVRDGPRAS